MFVRIITIKRCIDAEFYYYFCQPYRTKICQKRIKFANLQFIALALSTRALIDRDNYMYFLPL